MGRELRRKQAKREGKSLEREEENTSNTSLIKYFKVTLIVIIFGCLIYLLSALFVTKELDWFNKKEEETNNVSTNIILASQIFKQKEETYYVYFYDFDEEEKDITNTVTSKLSGDKVYKVNTKDALNNNYIGDKTNKKAKTLEDLKVKEHTLIKIVNDTIKEYYEGEEITKKLG